MNTLLGSEKIKGDLNKKHFRIIVLLALLAVLTVGASVYASVRLFSSSVRQERTEEITKVTRFVSEQINADRINDWLENGADSEYERTGALLQSELNNTPNLQYLYVYQIREDGCHIVYDLETTDGELEQYDERPELDTGSLGAVEPFDESFGEYIPDLLAGKEIGIIESNDRYGWLLTCYRPLYDSSGKCDAYAGADISMLGVNSGNRIFMTWIIGISSVLLAVLIIIGARLLERGYRAVMYDEFVKQQNHDQKLLCEVIEAFARVIDAKDKYTQGHSTRVAEYSERIARLSGKNEEECREIYYTALLHDVGKVGIPIGIINKDGRLTDDEYELIRQHSGKGNNILSSIKEFPYLSIGAHYHHERYDGKGYPEKLKGDDIPEIARIIAVADAYDAMTSNRSYRNAIPQDLVREEIVKGSGTQFDPKFAKAMQHLIDLDTEYDMKERAAVSELSGKNELVIGEYRSDYSEGILITQYMTTISMTVDPDESGAAPVPSLLLFDSLDGRIHDDDERKARELLYFEYGEIRLDGRAEASGARKMQAKTENTGSDEIKKCNEYKIQAVKVRDHVLIKVISRNRTAEITTALPDNTRYAYLALTGEHCCISNVSVTKAETFVSDGYIRRIAEEISYIDGPSGDIPNLQVDGFRSATTEGIPLSDRMTLDFHTKSLPTARLVWHCPFLLLFSSDNGRIDGENYREYALIRLDGENWESGGTAENNLIVNMQDSFGGWEAWKEYNKKGFDTSISIVKSENIVTVTTDNLGLFIKNTTKLPEDVETVYAAITGDQCAVTAIRIHRENGQMLGHSVPVA